MAPNAEMFREELCRQLQEAERKGDTFLEVKAGELHRAVGGYPGPDARMPICCSVMRSVLREKGGVIVQQPPKGNGASLTIRYELSPGDHALIDKDIYRKLISVAEDRATITYQELASLNGLTMDNPADRTRLANLLEEISRLEHARGRPMLSVVVVSKTTGMPGRGFFQLAREIGVHDGKDDLAFFVSELKNVHQYWGSCSEEQEENQDREEVSSEPAESDLEPPQVTEPETRIGQHDNAQWSAGPDSPTAESSSEEA